MRKGILLSVLLVLLTSSVSLASPSIHFDSVWWERKGFDSHFAGLGAQGQSSMAATVVVQDYETQRNLSNTIMAVTGPGAGSAIWSNGVQRASWDPSRYWFNTNLGYVDPDNYSNRTVWETSYSLSATFTDYDPDFEGSYQIAVGTFTNRLGMPVYAGTVPGGITWNAVTGADRYRITAYGLNEYGLPDLSVMLLSSDFLTANSYTFSEPHPAYDVAIAIEAIDFLGDPANNDWLRRSQYIFYSPAPVPVPSAVLLLGSGLIGLIGIRRKIRDRQS